MTDSVIVIVNKTTLSTPTLHLYKLLVVDVVSCHVLDVSWPVFAKKQNHISAEGGLKTRGHSDAKACRRALT
jgi:hypothetical protein